MEGEYRQLIQTSSPMNNPEDRYVRNLKKSHPDKPRECLHCKLFLESKKYKQGYSLIHRALGNHIKPLYECDTIDEALFTNEKIPKKVLFILPHPKERIRYEEYIKEYYQDYIVYTTYAIKCSPDDTVPKLHHTRMCSNFLRQEIEEIQPDLVITLGGISKEAWKEIEDENNQ